MADQYERSRAEMNNPAVVAAQSMFFTGPGRAKRGPPTPEMSGLTTPLGTDETMGQQEQMADEPPSSAHTAVGAASDPGRSHRCPSNAAGLGYNINDPAQVQQFLTKPIHTAGDVLNIVKSYHKTVVRPEMFGMVAQLESAIKTVHDHTFSCQKELQFMVADNRAAQKHAAGLQLVTTGWPNGLTPQQREYMLGWMLGKHTRDRHLPPGTWSSGHRTTTTPLSPRTATRVSGSTCCPRTRSRLPQKAGFFQWHDAPEF